jgi:uncharacterized membrane protein
MRSRTRSTLLIAVVSTAVAVGVIAIAREASALELLGYALFFFAIQVAATSQRNQKRCSG